MNTTPEDVSMSHTDYQRIAEALRFIVARRSAQPSLADLAQHLHLSQHHLHRLFIKHVGISPQQCLQVLNVQHARHLLRQHSVLESSLALGLSGSSRLHDHCISVEAVTPGELKSLGEGMDFHYGAAQTFLGTVCVIWNVRGLHRLFFSEAEPDALQHCRQQWPRARFTEATAEAQKRVDALFSHRDAPLRLWVKGSNFQINVWRALVAIPEGSVRAYADVAASIGADGAQRAVGSAVGGNPVAVLIPCHRVIRSSGFLHHYRWEPWRKAALLAREWSGSALAETNGMGTGERN